MTDPVILTFDIEKPCHMSIGGAGMSISEKDFEEGLSGLLKMLKSNSAKATFFIVAELVERHLNIFRQIAEEGHEIGLHSFYHKLIYKMTPEEFEKDTREGKKILEYSLNAKIFGYRAPSWSVHQERTPWFWEILKKNGFEYSSSISPFETHVYGDKKASRFPHFVETKFGRILEVPLPTCPFLINVPFSGGAYFRTMPDFVRRFFESSWQKSGFPIFYYFHARDLGFEKKPRNMDFFPGLINYAGNSMAKKKFLRIASEVRCVGMHDVISRLINLLEK